MVALLRDELWANPWMIAIFLAFIAYQIYLIVLGQSPGFVVLTVSTYSSWSPHGANTENDTTVGHPDD